jgi:hypothetical protein
MNTKTILAATALVALASPAFAKTTHKTTHKTAHHVSREEARPTDAYAAAPNARTKRSNHGSNDVYDVRGHYVGTDPDATIRDQLSRDPTQGD